MASIHVNNGSPTTPGPQSLSKIFPDSHDDDVDSAEQEERRHVLDTAEKEVGKMLQENLLIKFRETDQFKEISGMLFASSAMLSTRDAH